MTRKKVLSSGELIALQGQHAAPRGTYNGIAGSVHARDEEDEEDEEEEEEDSFRTARAIHGLSLGQPMTGISSESVSEAAMSPVLDNVTSPSVANWSFAEALSPASIVTPSVSSIGQPRRKRIRTSSSAIEAAEGEDGGERRVDLAGLLNPIGGNERQAYSPHLRIADLDNPQPYSRSDPRHLSHATETTSLTYRLGVGSGSGTGMGTVSGTGAEPGTGAGIGFGIGIGAGSGTPYVDIQPRPAGHEFKAETPGQARIQESEESRRKGRRGPLESDQRRQEVLEVRGIGACLRCHIMRIRCSAVKDEACANCKETLPKSRKWCIECTREWPRMRWHYLYPDMLRRFNDPDRCVPDYPAEMLGPPFMLPQTHWSRFTISVEARAVNLPADQKQEFDAHLYVPQGEEPNVRQVLKVKRGWYFVPRMKPGLGTYNQTVSNLLTALDSQREVIQRRWVADFIQPNQGQQWVREVLQLTIYFQREVMMSKALKAASLTLFIRHLMNAPFFIPDERLTEMNNEHFPDDQLEWKQLEELIAKGDAAIARPVNELLKKALAKVLEKCLPNHFLELESLFRLQENGGDQAKMSSLDRDEVFCVLILTFVLIATLQTWLLLHASSRDERLEQAGEQKRFRTEAKREIQSMETNVVDFFLNLYKYRFFKAEMKGQPGPDRLEDARKAAKFNVFTEFEKLRVRYEDEIYHVGRELDLEEKDDHTIVNKNHTRLLLRLSDAIWRPKSAR